jgi:N-acyl homoserine lactone hydrolase
MTTPPTMLQRLYLMQVVTRFIPAIGYGNVVCYLIETNDGKHILIDSGQPEDSADAPGMPPSEHERDVIAQLADLGLRPADIDILICTHFDVDHAGHHDAFPQAELIVQRAHYAVARSGHPRYVAARAHWDHPSLRYRLVEGDTEVLPGLTLIETSGHAPGHQSVLLRLPQTGPVLLAIDAVALRRLFTPERQKWPLDDDEQQLRASTQKLLDVVEREQVALVIFGHDAAQWQTLRKVPKYYE